MDTREIIDKLQDGQFSEFFDQGIKNINQEEDIKMVLARKIEEDIQQYLPDIADIWGDEMVVVKVKDDVAYVVWNEHWMPTIDFYQLVFKNSGIVEPKDFEGYENLL
jgi:hypothetical protein